MELDDTFDFVDVEIFSDRSIGNSEVQKEDIFTSEEKIYLKEIKEIENTFAVDIEDDFAFEDVQTEFVDKISQNAAKSPRKGTLHCSVCSYTTIKRRTLRYHKKTQHELKIESSDAEMLTCSVCSYTTKKRRTLRYHKNTQHEIKVESGDIEMLSCPVCSYKSGKKRNLRDHIRVHHVEGKGGSELDCPQCDYKTTLNRNLRRHTLKLHTDRAHLKSETFYCEMCTFSTHYKKNLRLHMGGKHNNNRSFPCSFDDCEYR